MVASAPAPPSQDVALLAEGVGRNAAATDAYTMTTTVALLAEGVGRNSQLKARNTSTMGRPPRGGRG